MFGKLLSEDGSVSAMRMAVLGCLALYFPAFVGIWVRVSWTTSTMAPIPDSVIWLLGTLLSAKIGQKVFEIVGQIFGPQPSGEPPQ